MKRFFLILIVLFPIFIFGKQYTSVDFFSFPQEKIDNQTNPILGTSNPLPPSGYYEGVFKVNGDEIFISIIGWDSEYTITIRNRSEYKRVERIGKIGVKDEAWILKFSERGWVILKKDLDVIQKKFLEWINVAKSNHVTSLTKSFPVENLSLQSPLFYNSLLKEYDRMDFEIEDSKALLKGCLIFSFNEKSIPHLKNKVDEALKLAKQNGKELELFK